VVKVKRESQEIAGKDIIHYLDNIEDEKSFVEYLNEYEQLKSGGSIAIEKSLWKILKGGHEEKKLKEFVEAAQKNNIEIYIVEVEGEEEIGNSELKEYGLMGKIDIEKGKIYTIKNEKEEEVRIINFESEQELERQIKEVEGKIILRNNQLEKILSEAKSAHEQSAIKRIFSVVLKAGIMRRNRLENLVNNWSIKDFEDVRKEEYEKIAEGIKAGKSNEEIVKEWAGSAGENVMKLKIKIYLKSAWYKDAEPEIREDFCKNIVMKIIAKEALEKAGKGNGLKEKKWEMILGKAISIKTENATEALEYSDEEMKKMKNDISQGGNETMANMEERIAKELKELEEKMEEKDQSGKFTEEAKAAAKKAEAMIVLFSQEERDAIQTKEDIETQDYKKILSAA
jgi:hypothetical protein